MSVPAVAGMYAVRLGDATWTYELRRSRRRTLGITVMPDGSLVVTAPLSAALERVEAVLRRRRTWISRRSHEAVLLPPPPAPRAWVSGETHRYLGRQYRLRIRRGEPQVLLSGQFFNVRVPDTSDADTVRHLMESWYRTHARQTFARRLDHLVLRTAHVGLAESPPLLVRKLRTRWGSCSTDGRILMNVDAVKLPLPCVDYLLLHELCHLRVPNHGAGFWRLLDACMPDWERWRKRLGTAEI